MILKQTHNKMVLPSTTFIAPSEGVRRLVINNTNAKTPQKVSNESGAGFIALTSAIVISVLLLAITVSLGFSGFFTVFNVLDSESKERAVSLAEACVDTAVLNIAKDESYNPSNQSIIVGSDHCRIISVAPSGNNKIIKTQACVNKSVANLRVIIGNNFKIASWEELPNFSPNTPCI